MLLFATGANAQDPPGNNGTIKVDDQPIDAIPNNNPHVGCEFRVDIYGYDRGVGGATVTFESQAPTKSVGVWVAGDTSPDIGEDAAGGGTDLDASETYTLSFDGDPHPQQGFHVRLTVNAPGSIGNDVKHKVFWVEGCPTEPPPTEPPPTEPPPTEPPSTDTPPTDTPPPTPPTEVVAGVGGGSDNGSGPGSWWSVGLIGSGSVLAGGAALASRRRGDHQA